MKSCTRRWVMIFMLCLLGFSASERESWAKGDFSLVDQGWRIVEKEGKRNVEMSALVINQSKTTLSYEVRFVAAYEAAKNDQQPNQSIKNPAGSKEKVWLETKVISVRGGPLAPGASAEAKAVFDHQVLVTGKVCRFRAELVNSATGAVLATATITAAKAAAVLGISSTGVIAAMGAAGIIAIANTVGGAESSPEIATASGTGTMVGQHETHRVNDEWVEHGSGVIDVTGSQGHLVLNYVYDAQGPNADNLTATATANGTLTPPSGAPQSVEITSASAQITQAGSRQQTGPVITRTGSRATGTFSGTVGGRAWSGLLTMTNGVMTLDLNSDTGSHQFDIEFTASR